VRLAALESVADCLREEALLRFGYLVEPLGGFFALFSHNTILQLI
jgi:hypothetical protein